jgi:Sodium/hydrogen exchanger family
MSCCPIHASFLDSLNTTDGIAALWVGLAVLASVISIRIGLSVALVEILVGVVGGNLLGMTTTDWIDFLAGFGSVLLTFLAGAEIDPASLRRFLAPSLAIGTIGFVFPFAGAWPSPCTSCTGSSTPVRSPASPSPRRRSPSSMP